MSERPHKYSLPEPKPHDSVFTFYDVASNGNVDTFPNSQAGYMGIHKPARGLLGCIPDPLGKLKNEFSVKPASWLLRVPVGTLFF